MRSIPHRSVWLKNVEKGRVRPEEAFLHNGPTRERQRECQRASALRPSSELVRFTENAKVSIQTVSSPV